MLSDRDIHGLPAPPGQHAQGGPWRAALLAVVLLSVLLAVTPYNDYFICGSYMANHHVPIAASFVLVMLCLLVNPVLGRLGKRLSQRELTLIWAMLAASSGMASAGFLRFLVPTIPALRYFASGENRWEQGLWPHVPSWMTLTDERAVSWFYDGSPGGGGVPWDAWAGPIATWTAVALLMFATLFCLATLLKTQWIRHERMTFVQTQLPLALISSPEPGRAINAFFSDGRMWIGFSLAFILCGLIGLPSYFPVVPKITFLYPNFYAQPLNFEARPWNAASPIYLAIFPSTVGFSFLMTTEVSLSAWVFFVLFRLEAVVFSALGLELKSMTSGYAAKQFTAYQDMGGYIALVGSGLWVARRHLGRAWRMALGSEEGQGAGGYRFAFLGGAVCLVLLAALLNAAGVSMLVAGAFFLAYFVICVGVSWITSNVGMLQLVVLFRPEDFLYSCIGTRSLTPRDIAILAIPSRAFTFYYNEMPMPHFLNSYKIGHETGTPERWLAGGAAVAVPLGMAVAWVAHLLLVYSKGAFALQKMSFIDWPRTPFQVAQTYISQPAGPDPMSYLFIALGAAVFLGVGALRNGTSWWPLHPAGLLIGSAIQELWLSVFIAWLSKALVLRYGGAGAYKRARTFFLGLALGEISAACFWIVLGLITKTGVRLLP